MKQSALNIAEEEVFEPRASKVSIDDKFIAVTLEDGRVIMTPLSFYPKLASASKEELQDFRLFWEGEAIHFNALDEDISIEALISGRKQITGIK